MDQSYDLPDKPTLWPAAVHRFLLETSFYPLVFCTSLCFAFLAARTYVRQELGYAFLVKNLFLAWVPYFLSLMAIHLHRLRPTSRWRLGIVWSAWLVMFPNAPYIFTDLIHWRSRVEMPWWFDLGVVLMFALAGCFLGIVSLRIMHDLVRRGIGPVGGWLFVVIVASNDSQLVTRNSTSVAL